MRNLGLDVLRLVAVLLVLGRHLHLPSSSNWFHPVLQFWQTGGWIGVDLFFVLSGFLVSGLLFREYLRDRQVNIKRFLIRRGFKIYPAFYAMILFTIAVRAITGQPLPLGPLLGELLFFQNYLGALWTHTWSLAVEEHFYIGIAVLCFFLLRNPRASGGSANPFRAIPAIFMLVAVVCLGFRIAQSLIFESYSHQWFLFGTHIRIDSLMFGVLISYLWHFHDLEARLRSVKTPVLLMSGSLCLLPPFLFPVEEHKFISVYGLILFYVGSGLLVVSSVRLRSSRRWPLMLLGALGAASYSIYLWHIPMARWAWLAVKKVTGLEGFGVYFLFYIVGSLAFGWVMNKILEWPLLRLRDRLFPKSSKAMKPGKAAQVTTSSAVPDL